jgi:hypothetical protein
MFKVIIAFFSVILLLFLIRINNRNNPIIIKPEWHNFETYFPTPSVIILEKESSEYRIHYFCANHKLVKDNLYVNFKYEQPCEECLNSNHFSSFESAEYIGGKWEFFTYEDITKKQVVGTFIPDYWKNPLTKIKNYDMLQETSYHGLTVDDIDIKLIYKNSPWTHTIGTPSDYVDSFQKTKDKINYLDKWYYKVPKFDISKLKSVGSDFFGINYKIEDYK